MAPWEQLFLVSLGRMALRRRQVGGSGARVGRSCREGSTSEISPAGRRVSIGKSRGTNPRWRAKEMAAASSFAPSAERRPPHSPRRAFPVLPHSHPPNRQTLSPPQQHSISVPHKELEAKSGPMPSHRQIRAAKTGRSQIRRPRLAYISKKVISPVEPAHNTPMGRGEFSEGRTRSTPHPTRTDRRPRSRRSPLRSG